MSTHDGESIVTAPREPLPDTFLPALAPWGQQAPVKLRPRAGRCCVTWLTHSTFFTSRLGGAPPLLHSYCTFSVTHRQFLSLFENISDPKLYLTWVTGSLTRCYLSSFKTAQFDRGKDIELSLSLTSTVPPPPPLPAVHFLLSIK